MITVKHPDEECNRQQEAMLASCHAEKRRFHELLFIFGNITHRYHQRAKSFQPTEEDWREWLEGLPENIHKSMRELGFEKSRNVLSFTRYVMEKNDVGMEEYVRQRMGEADYAEYMAFINTKKG